MPLSIRKVLVSQPLPSNPKSPYFTLAEEYGIEFDFKPFFLIESVTAREFRDQKVNILDHTAVVLTSRSATDHFFRMVRELRLTIPDTMKYFCGSETVATYLQKYIVYRKRKIFFAPTGQPAELHQLVVKHPKESYFVPFTEGTKDDLFKVMEEKKISHTKSVLYRSVSQKFTKEELASYDMIIFFSPNGIASLFENNPNYKQGKQLIACFGEGTAKAIEAANLKVDLIAPTPEYPSMTAALETFLKKNIEK